MEDPMLSVGDQQPGANHVQARSQKGYDHPVSPSLDAGWLRQLCLEAGAGDVGFVQIERPEINDQRADIFALYPWTKTLLSFVCRMNREPIRSPARSVANLEFHHTHDQVNDTAHTIVAALEERGMRAVNPAMGFPMEMDRLGTGKAWVVSHKPVAVAAGLGQMGIHRNVIHPKFGNFILLGTVLIDAQVSGYSKPIDYNPCLECKLCVAACPVGAIGADGHFDFNACYTHNYREFMGGFTDWVEKVADSKGAKAYRSAVSDSESASMWQSLSFGANYKAAYCMAVCPAGENILTPFVTNRKEFVQTVVKPLQGKEEIIYVVPGSDAEAHVAHRFPHKKAKQVGNGLRPRSIQQFAKGLPVTFQRHQSEGLNATYHFSFYGEEEDKVTVTIREKTIQVQDGHVGIADLVVTADSRTWLHVIAKEQNILWAFIRRKIRIKGSSKLLVAFGKCFPS
jgi:Fe-S-cluster-containing hydrogenase component 2